MISETVNAWILHTQKSGETSAYVTFFTDKYGLIRALCKGGRKGKRSVFLQAFTPLCVTFDVKYDRHYVRAIDVTQPSLQLTSDGLMAAFYLNELLFLTQLPLEPVESLYHGYVRSLNELSVATGKPDIERTLRRFEWQILTIGGYAMSLTHDAQTGLPIDPVGYYELIVGEGFIKANKGFLGEYILALSDQYLENVDVLRHAKWIMRRAIAHMLDGKTIKTRELYLIKNH